MMKSLTIYFFAYLQSKPRAGIASGFLGGAIVAVQHLLTNDTFIKMVVAFGACCSAFVAFVTLIATISKYIRIAIKKHRRKNKIPL